MRSSRIMSKVALPHVSATPSRHFAAFMNLPSLNPGMPHFSTMFGKSVNVALQVASWKQERALGPHWRSKQKPFPMSDVFAAHSLAQSAISLNLERSFARVTIFHKSPAVFFKL